MQRALGAGDADVHQTAFFLQFGWVERFAVWQDAFLNANQKDMLVLQPFGGVQGRELHGVDVFAVLLVEHVDQGDALHHVDQGFAVFLALLVDPFGKFADIGPARLRGAGFLAVEQVALVINRFEQVGQHLLCRFAGSAVLHAVDELAEFQQRFELPGLYAMGKAMFESGVE